MLQTRRGNVDVVPDEGLFLGCGGGVLAADYGGGVEVGAVVLGAGFGHPKFVFVGDGGHLRAWVDHGGVCQGRGVACWGC